MRRNIGVTTAEHIVAGLVEDHKVVGPLRIFPEKGSSADDLSGMTVDAIAERIRAEIIALAKDQEIGAIGVGFPGIIRNGMVEDSPNLSQIKGVQLEQIFAAALREGGVTAPVKVFNDADVMAAGLAATKGHLGSLIRVWTLGNGIGYGRYPFSDGVWEGGHTVVSLDPNENYCGCGGRGHLEGFMGHRAMRLRFMDLEPDEVFDNAEKNDTRCCDFVKLWHRALAAGSANSIHMSGPGKFFLTGHYSRRVNINMLNQYTQEMVKMSPLQGYSYEVVAGGEEIAVIGAAVNAEQAVYPAGS